MYSGYRNYAWTIAGGRAAMALSEAEGAAREDASAPVAEGYRARFYPQAWQRDCAVDVDAEGETEWRPSRLPGDLQDAADRAGGIPVLDRADALKDDPAAPAWIRAWNGPFSITVWRTADWIR